MSNHACLLMVLTHLVCTPAPLFGAGGAGAAGAGGLLAGPPLALRLVCAGQLLLAAEGEAGGRRGWGRLDVLDYAVHQACTAGE